MAMEKSKYCFHGEVRENDVPSVIRVLTDVCLARTRHRIAMNRKIGPNSTSGGLSEDDVKQRRQRAAVANVSGHLEREGQFSVNQHR